MTGASTVQSLRGVHLFHDIADDHLQRLADIARPVEFPEHSEIFHEHDRSKNVYVIISGRVSLAILDPGGGARELMQVGDGELVGWSPLVGRPRLSDTAKTLTPVTALVIDGDQALELCHNDPEFGCEFMHRVAMAVAERLAATRLKLMELGGHQQLPDVQIESD